MEEDYKSSDSSQLQPVSSIHFLISMDHSSPNSEIKKIFQLVSMTASRNLKMARDRKSAALTALTQKDF